MGICYICKHRSEKLRSKATTMNKSIITDRSKLSWSTNGKLFDIKKRLLEAMKRIVSPQKKEETYSKSYCIARIIRRLKINRTKSIKIENSSSREEKNPRNIVVIDMTSNDEENLNKTSSGWGNKLLRLVLPNRYNSRSSSTFRRKLNVDDSVLLNNPKKIQTRTIVANKQGRHYETELLPEQFNTTMVHKISKDRGSDLTILLPES